MKIVKSLPSLSDQSGEVGRATIREVAERAGVSMATVSRAVNRPDSLKPETLDRVRAVMEELSYAPNGAARTLISGKTGNIAAVMLSPLHPSSRDEFFLEILKGIEAGVGEAGLNVMVAVQPADDPRQERIGRLLASGTVDGLVVMGRQLASRHRATIRRNETPTILLGPHPTEPSVWSVAADSRQGSEEAVRHLIETGRRRIVHISGPVDQATAGRKLEGYRLAHARAGLEVDPKLHVVEEATHSRDGGQRAMEQLLERGVALDAVYASDDLVAFGAMRALRDAGRRIPDDVAVIGYGDLDEAQFSAPSLTSVHVDFRQQGWLAGTVLARAVAGSAPPSTPIRIETRLIVRQSSAPRGDVHR
jgi:DNA-binding LacI/PurR family transcriptional regulator